MSILTTLKTWLERVYVDNGLWPTVGVILLAVAVVAALTYLGIIPSAWLSWLVQ